ncbi:MAG: PIN domain-containing protein [Thermodesulfovibrionia bacterium]|nr:PIN domain-containing protein [Thermodesulfovibrionia bacterium]
MPALVDTSVWIEYFRNGNNVEKLDFLIDENLVVTNDLILAELIPFLKLRKQKSIIGLLNDINKLQLHIKWDEIIDYQVQCLKKGANGVSIPDLIIAQNAKQNDCEIYSMDKHFKLLKSIVNIKITT